MDTQILDSMETHRCLGLTKVLIEHEGREASRSLLWDAGGPCRLSVPPPRVVHGLDELDVQRAGLVCQHVHRLQCLR